MRRHCSPAGVFRHVRQNDVPFRSACCPNPLLCKAFLCTGNRKKNSAQKTNKKGRTADPKFVRLVRRMHSQQARSTEIPRRFPHSKPSWPLGDTTKATRRHDSHHHPRYTRLARECTLASHACLARVTLCVTLCSELELVVQGKSLKNSQWRLSDWPNKAARRIFGIPTKAVHSIHSSGED